MLYGSQSRSVLERTQQALLSAYEDGRLGLVLGAGVSADLEVPDWWRLVGKLADGTQSLRLVPARVRKTMDLPTMVDLISSELKPDALEGRLRSLLYPANLTRGWVHRHGESHHPFERTAPGSLARLALRVAMRSPGRRVQIVTYNFDTLMEEAVTHAGAFAETIAPVGNGLAVVGEWSPTSRASGLRRQAHRLEVCVQVHHPHGVIGRDKPWSTDPIVAGKWTLSELIFGSRSYEDRLASPYSPPSVVQLNTFGTLSCIFYGFSFADVLVRAVLNAAVRTNARPRTESTSVFPHVGLFRSKDLNSFAEDALNNLFTRYDVGRVRTQTFAQQRRFIDMLTMTIDDHAPAPRAN